MSADSIIFPGLGITLTHVGRGINVFGFEIAYYGVVIAIGMVIAAFYISKNCERYGQNKNDYMDMTLYGIISGVVGARLYYVAFSWDMYKDNLLSIFNLRAGGLAIFGGIIFGAALVFIFCFIKKIYVYTAGDVVIGGVLIGQIFGRWGNFFNREAFGGYSNGPLAMGIPIDAVRSASDITSEMRDNILVVDGVDFITVHPTFLYESLFNLGILILILILSRRPHRPGSMAALYFIGYGIGRFFIESLRTDQLFLWGSRIPVSMVVAIISLGFGIFILLYNRKRERS